MKWLEIKNGEVYIENKKLFNELNLFLKLGENAVIIGPNGSGKSTLLNLINRTIYPIVKQDSYIKIFGKKNINIWELRSLIGFLNKDIELRIKPKAKILNVVLSGYLGKIEISSSEAKRISHKQKDAFNLLEKFDLINHASQDFSSLSDGQKRKLILARSLINNPKVLVLDEPTTNLDIKSKYSLTTLLNKLKIDGITILQVTHDISSINSYDDKVILLKDFKIVASGSPIDILTSDNISKLFDTNLEVVNNDNFWQIIQK